VIAEVSNLAFRKKLTFLLVIALLLSVFLGGYHHTCDCYSQSCSICSQAGHQPVLLPTTAIAADENQPLLVKVGLFWSEEIFPDPALSYTPLSGRAPPRLS